MYIDFEAKLANIADPTSMSNEIQYSIDKLERMENLNILLLNGLPKTDGENIDVIVDLLCRAISYGRDPNETIADVYRLPAKRNSVNPLSLPTDAYSYAAYASNYTVRNATLFLHLLSSCASTLSTTNSTSIYVTYNLILI